MRQYSAAELADILNSDRGFPLVFSGTPFPIISIELLGAR
jgi:hypothetical protein